MKADLHRGLGDETIYSQYKVSNDVEGLRKQFDQEDELNLIARGAKYVDEEDDAFTRGYVERSLENEKISKEDQQEFDDIWQQTTGDIYSNLKDDLKTQYDQARLIMKLNQQLRYRLISSSKQTRQLLNQTMRLKDKVVTRIETSSKDFQGDVLPSKAFDFIQ